MDAIQTKQSTSFFPLIQHFENLPVCVYEAYKQILITANEPFGAITNWKSQFVLGGRGEGRGPSPSQTLPYLCHSCVILPGSEIFKKTKTVEADDRGYHKIAVRIKEKVTSKECKFHSSSQQSPKTLKNRRKNRKHFECLRSTDLSLFFAG